MQYDFGPDAAKAMEQERQERLLEMDQHFHLMEAMGQEEEDRSADLAEAEDLPEQCDHGYTIADWFDAVYCEDGCVFGEPQGLEAQARRRALRQIWMDEEMNGTANRFIDAAARVAEEDDVQESQ